MIFNAVANALAFMISKKGVEDLDHYLDDFVIVTAAQFALCERALLLALDTCHEAGCPVSLEKNRRTSNGNHAVGCGITFRTVPTTTPTRKTEEIE